MANARSLELCDLSNSHLEDSVEECLDLDNLDLRSRQIRDELVEIKHVCHSPPVGMHDVGDRLQYPGGHFNLLFFFDFPGLREEASVFTDAVLVINYLLHARRHYRTWTHSFSFFFVNFFQFNYFLFHFFILFWLRVRLRLVAVVAVSVRVKAVWEGIHFFKVIFFDSNRILAQKSWTIHSGFSRTRHWQAVLFRAFRGLLFGFCKRLVFDAAVLFECGVFLKIVWGCFIC